MLDQFELKLCDVRGRIFEKSLRYNISSEEFVKKTMRSEVMKHFDLPYSHVQWAGEEYDLSLLAEELGLEELPANANRDAVNGGAKGRYNPDILYWMGYFYGYWHFHSGLDSRQMLQIASPSKLAGHYMRGHVMAPELLIEDLIRES